MAHLDLLHPWLTDDGVAPFLDEHHMAVLADDAGAREAFESSLNSHLEGMPDTTVHRIQGARILSLESFAEALGTALGCARPTAGFGGIVETLRSAVDGPKRRYIVWSDADVLLEQDVALFSRLVNAMLSVAAEREYLTPDPLIVERYVFLGGPKLGAYAEDFTGQFWRWLDEPEVASVRRCVEYPRVLACRIEE